MGHREGVEALRKTVTAAQELGVEHITVFSFSTENWNRPPTEIEALFELLKIFVKRDLARLHKEGVCIRILGEREGVPDDILALIDNAVETTKYNSNLFLNIAFNYGGRAEITSAMKRIAERVVAGEVSPGDVTEDLIAQHLWSSESPDPDLLIRTSGELRISNFLLWSGAYTELMFLDVRWPDFDRSCMEQAIDAYRRRDRRFGGLKE